MLMNVKYIVELIDVNSRQLALFHNKLVHRPTPDKRSRRKDET